MGIEIEDAEDARFIEGEDDAIDELTAFITKLKNSSESERGFKVTLIQAGNGLNGPNVDSIDFTLDMEPSELAERLVEVAAEDATKFPGKTRYAARAFVAGNVKRCVFVLNNPRSKREEDDDDLGELIDEPANARGTLALSNKIAIAMASSQLKASQVGTDVLQQTIRSLERRCEALQNKLDEKDRLIEDVRSLQWERDMARRKFEKEEERRDQGMKVLAMGGSLIASKYLGLPPGALAGMMGAGDAPAGQPVGQSAGQPDQNQTRREPPATGPQPDQTRGGQPSYEELFMLSMNVESFMSALSEKHFEAFMRMFEPLELASLQEIYTRVASMKQRREAARSAGQPSAGRPEQSAYGSASNGQPPPANGNGNGNGTGGYAPFTPPSGST